MYIYIIKETLPGREAVHRRGTTLLLRGLQSRVSDIQKYLVEVSAGMMPLNHQIIYHLLDALNLSPDPSDTSITWCGGGLS
jgi:hypothetical protein